ncbi:MAG: ATP-binding cassette domain-containing protein [Metamycoplasmataceae bacterium]
MKIIVSDLVKYFDDGINKKVFTLGNLSLELNQGEFVAIIGPTGSGKTTFIEHLNVLSIPSSGTIAYKYEQKISKKNYKDIRKNDKKLKVISENDIEKVYQKEIIVKKARKIKETKEIRKKIGIVFQFAEYQLFEETIEKDIMFGPINLGIPKQEAYEIAKRVIVEVGLSEEYLKKSPFSLSGGQKRRIALAGILAMNPDYLIFDEPTAGLDPAGAKDILNLFKKLNNSGHTIIIVTHDLDNVLKWSDRTILFSQGKILRDGKTIDVLEDIDFLLNNKMEPPKLLAFRDKLLKKGMKIGHVRTIEELASEINKIRKEPSWK